MTRALLSVALFAAGFIATANAQEIVRPTYKIGDSWTVKYARGSETQQVIGVGDKIVIMINGDKNRAAEYTLDFNTISGYGAKTGSPISYDPPTPTFKFPIVAGAKWEGQTRWRSGQWGNRSDVSAVVGAATKVSIGQKEFDAVLIRYEYIDWANRGSKTRSTCWFSAEVKRLVKCDSDDPGYTFEITDFYPAEKEAAR
jgi:hypothetical protein